MKYSLTLTIDTAHPIARATLVEDGKCIAERTWPNTPNVGTDLLVYIDELLQECGFKKEDIRQVKVHPGPGSYGLVRTGIVTATLFAQSIGAELVNSIDV